MLRMSEEERNLTNTLSHYFSRGSVSEIKFPRPQYPFSTAPSIFAATAPFISYIANLNSTTLVKMTSTSVLPRIPVFLAVMTLGTSIAAATTDWIQSLSALLEFNIGLGFVVGAVYSIKTYVSEYKRRTTSETDALVVALKDLNATFATLNANIAASNDKLAAINDAVSGVKAAKLDCAPPRTRNRIRRYVTLHSLISFVDISSTPQIYLTRW